MSTSFYSAGAHALALCVAWSIFPTSQAAAAIIESFNIGVGANLASIQVDQQDGDGYLFNVRWDATNYTSWDALLEIDAALPSFSLTYDTYSWGIFLTGITIDGDVNFGTGDLWPIENYWHFWLQDAGNGNWDQAMFGATDRTLFDGASDAWVFGGPNVPQSIPAPGVFAIMLFSVGVRPRRRRSSHMKASLAH